MASLSRIVSTPDLTEQVDQRLLHAICDGELVPDARLTQEELAVALGVSRPARAPGAAASARALWRRRLLYDCPQRTPHVRLSPECSAGPAETP